MSPALPSSLASCNPISAETGTSGGDVGVHVVHVTAHPRLCMNKYLSTVYAELLRL